jgi:hypothetical protein
MYLGKVLKTLLIIEKKNLTILDEMKNICDSWEEVKQYSWEEFGRN